MNSRWTNVAGGPRKGDISAYYPYKARLASGLDQKQVSDEVRLGTAILPIGTIIGTAVAGSILLFLILALIIRHLLRSRHKRKNKLRKSLIDDNEEDLIESLCATRPTEIVLGPQRKLSPTHVAKEFYFKRRVDPKLTKLQLTRPSMATPSCSFQVMGLRDSWPLVGWMPILGQPLYVDGLPINNPENNCSHELCFSFPQSTGSALTCPRRVFSRPFTGTGGRDNILMRSMHMANSSISSVTRPSGNRRSTSDNQLASILRSTSQRLKEAPRRPSQSAMNPPSSLRDEREENREAMIEPDDASYAESVRSSVLYLKSNTPSPMKDSLYRTDFLRRKREETSPVSNTPKLDTVRQSLKPESFIPLALSSPSRHRAKTRQGFQTWNMSTSQSSTKIFEDDWAVSNREVAVHERKLPKRLSWNDPFVSPSGNTNGNSQSPLKGSLDSESKRGDVVDKKLPFKSAESSLRPLSPIYCNQQSRNITRLASADTQARKEINPFQWSPQATRSVVMSPTSRLGGLGRKGHRRQKTIRLSNLPRPVSVSVVLEELESEATPKSTQQTLRKPDLHLSPTKMTGTSLFAQGNEAIYEMRPPSVTAFQPLLKISSPNITPESRRTSCASYSATMSFCDYYASPPDARLSQTSVDELAPSTPPSPTPFMKRAHRRGHNFSVDISRNDNLTRQSFVKVSSQTNSLSSYQVDDTLSLPKSMPARTTSFDLCEFSAESPALVARLHGPRPLPVPAPSGSITESVSMLRRMNSEVSTYSNASNHSMGSPTIPTLRGGGLGPVKSQSSGTRKYLSIGFYTPSPHQRGSRLHDSVIVHRRRTYDHLPLSKDNKISNSLPGLVMPVIDHSAPEVASSKSYMEDSTPPLSAGKISTTELQIRDSSLMVDKNCQACNKPLPSLRLDSHVDGLAYQYHDHCFVCAICKWPLKQAYSIEKLPYCKEHYLQKVNDPSSWDLTDNKQTRRSNEQKNSSGVRWLSDATKPPSTQSVHHESQMKMPSPQGFLSQNTANWRTSLGLYDEMGFLKSSPDRSPKALPRAKQIVAE